MSDFSVGFTEGSFLLLNGQKHLRSVAEDLISNTQIRTKRIYKEQRPYGHYKTQANISQANISQQVITF